MSVHVPVSSGIPEFRFLMGIFVVVVVVFINIMYSTVLYIVYSIIPLLC